MDSLTIRCEWEDGSVEIRYRGQKLGWEEIQERTRKPAVGIAPQRRRASVLPAATMQDHPWRRGYQDMKQVDAPPGTGSGAPTSMEGAR